MISLYIFTRLNIFPVSFRKKKWRIKRESFNENSIYSSLYINLNAQMKRDVEVTYIFIFKWTSSKY